MTANRSVELVPTTSRQPSQPPSMAELRTSRALRSIQRSAIVRTASVQSHAIVQNEKLQEVNRLAREAMSGQALLGQWRSTLAQGDPFVEDDLRFFTDIARIGKGEIIADTIADFCQEGR